VYAITDVMNLSPPLLIPRAYNQRLYYWEMIICNAVNKDGLTGASFDIENDSIKINTEINVVPIIRRISLIFSEWINIFSRSCCYLSTSDHCSIICVYRHYIYIICYPSSGHVVYLINRRGVDCSASIDIFYCVIWTSNGYIRYSSS
jgi:hypothetical protein